MKNASVLLTAGLALGMLSVSAHAVPVAPPGTESSLIAVHSEGVVTATYEGSGASYSNDIYLMLDALGNPGNDGNPANDRFIFNNHSASVGDSVNLGTFSRGSDLSFRLHVNATGFDYFTGAPSNNPDGMHHARAAGNELTNTTLLSFEDLHGGGDNNFSDMSISLSNTLTAAIPASIPEPEAYAMLLAGLGMIGAITRRRRVQSRQG